MSGVRVVRAQRSTRRFYSNRIEPMTREMAFLVYLFNPNFEVGVLEFRIAGFNDATAYYAQRSETSPAELSLMIWGFTPHTRFPGETGEFSEERLDLEAQWRNVTFGPLTITRREKLEQILRVMPTIAWGERQAKELTELTDRLLNAIRAWIQPLGSFVDPLLPKAFDAVTPLDRDVVLFTGVDPEGDGVPMDIEARWRFVRQAVEQRDAGAVVEFSTAPITYIHTGHRPLSTSWEANVALEFARKSPGLEVEGKLDKRGVVLRILALRGTPAICVMCLKSGKIDIEREILLPDGLVFTMTRVTHMRVKSYASGRLLSEMGTVSIAVIDVIAQRVRDETHRKKIFEAQEVQLQTIRDELRRRKEEILSEERREREEERKRKEKEKAKERAKGFKRSLYPMIHDFMRVTIDGIWKLLSFRESALVPENLAPLPETQFYDASLFATRVREYIDRLANKKNREVHALLSNLTMKLTAEDISPADAPIEQVFADALRSVLMEDEVLPKKYFTKKRKAYANDNDGVIVPLARELADTSIPKLFAPSNTDSSCFLNATFVPMFLLSDAYLALLTVSLSREFHPCDVIERNVRWLLGSGGERPERRAAFRKAMKKHAPDLDLEEILTLSPSTFARRMQRTLRNRYAFPIRVATTAAIRKKINDCSVSLRVRISLCNPALSFPQTPLPGQQDDPEMYEFLIRSLGMEEQYGLWYVQYIDRWWKDIHLDGTPRRMASGEQRVSEKWTSSVSYQNDVMLRTSLTGSSTQTAAFVSESSAISSFVEENQLPPLDELVSKYNIPQEIAIRLWAEIREREESNKSKKHWEGKHLTLQMRIRRRVIYAPPALGVLVQQRVDVSDGHQFKTHKSMTPSQKLNLPALQTRTQRKQFFTYQLTGIVYHVGTIIHAGHYVSYFRSAREPTQWYFYDDMTGKYVKAHSEGQQLPYHTSALADSKTIRENSRFFLYERINPSSRVIEEIK